MIKRFYFMTYQTARGAGLLGNASFNLTSWLPNHNAALERLTRIAVDSVGGQPIVVTSFYRVR